jgi:hypothetical protein
LFIRYSRSPRCCKGVEQRWDPSPRRWPGLLRGSPLSS